MMMIIIRGDGRLPDWILQRPSAILATNYHYYYYYYYYYNYRDYYRDY